jgi:phage/plasmid-associated DNA primase
MKRRWTILKFARAYNGPKMRNFSNVVFNSDPQGLVNFALKGLKKLVESQGYFTQFESSTRELEEWSEESDVVGQFVEEAIRGEFSTQLVKHEDAKIERKVLYDMFNEWQKDSGYHLRPMSKIEFFKRVKSKAFEVKTIKGVRYFSGLGELTSKHTASNEPKLNNDNI